MSFSETSANGAAKKWKKGDSTYTRTLDSERENSDIKSPPSKGEKMSSKITLTKKVKRRQERTLR